MPFRYPISLELEGRRCIVVGGGEVARQKVMALLEAGADVTVVAETFVPELDDLAQAGRLRVVAKRYSSGDLDGAFLAIAATDDSEVNARIFQEANENRVLLNAVDDVDHCHFAVPSIVRRGDLTLAISTGGKAPALAKRLRAELGKQLPSELGSLVDLLGEVRAEALESREVDFDTWAERWRLALSHDLLEMVAGGRAEEAREIVRKALREGKTSDAAARPAGKVSIVGAGPGDPALMTLRGRDLLREADVVVHDHLVHPSLFSGKRAIFAGKKASSHAIEQEQINKLLVRLVEEGNKVVRLKGGDPFVFGRGAEEAEALAEAGVEFEVVPAPTSAIAALAYAGIPVTDRRFASSVAFVTGHCTGASQVRWSELATAADTLVVLMGLAQLEDIVSRLVAGGRDPDTPSAIVEKGTLPEQRVITSNLAGLAAAAVESGIKSPAIVVIGEVVRLRERIAWFEATPPSGEEGTLARRASPAATSA